MKTEEQQRIYIFSCTFFIYFVSPFDNQIVYLYMDLMYVHVYTISKKGYGCK